MKIRCGSHQQNRSIVRPGLSLMATKVALTAEEFRENSQRSIALFGAEKLSTDSTHVLKSAYCILCISAVAICTGRVEAKGKSACPSASGRCVAICTGRVEAKSSVSRFSSVSYGCNLHGACGGKVHHFREVTKMVCVAICTGRVEDLASSPEKNPRKFMQTYCIFIHLGV